jgi:hypothetical protein
MDRDQLELLRRQVEEDYRLDMAAIERLERRYIGAANSAHAAPPASGLQVNTYVSPSKWSEEIPDPRIDTRVDSRPDFRPDPRVDTRIDPPGPLMPSSARAERQNDELVGSIRSMFSSGRI